MRRFTARFFPRTSSFREILQLAADNQTATDNDPAVDPQQSASRVDFPFVVERLLGRQLPPAVRYGMSLVVLLAGGWQLRQSRNRAPLLEAGFACLTVVICIYHNIYDALLLGVPLIAVWCETTATPAASPPRRHWLTLCCLLLPAVNYLSSRQFVSALAELHPAPRATAVQRTCLVAALHA